MKNIKFLIPFLIVIVISFIVVVNLYKVTDPLGGIELNSNPKIIEQRADKLQDILGLNLINKVFKISLKKNNELIRQTQSLYGIEKSNKILRDSLFGYFWEVSWLKPEDVHVVLGSNDENNNNNELPVKLKFNFNANGRLIKYSRDISDSLKTETLPIQEAKDLSINFLKKYTWCKGLNFSKDSLNNTVSNVKFVNQISIERPNRTDYEFTWRTRSGSIHDPIIIKSKISGNLVTDFSTEYKIPEKYKQEDKNVFHSVAIIVLIVLVGIFMLMVAFKRIRAYEIGFKIAIWIGIIYGLCFAFKILLESQGIIQDWQILFPAVLGFLFLGGFVSLIWAISEVIIRENWKDKFVTIDLLTNGYLLHSKVSKSVISGIGFGVLLSAAWHLLLFISGSFTNYLNSSNFDLNIYSSFSPTTSLFTENILGILILITSFFMFIIPVVRKRFSSSFILIIIGGLVWGFTYESSIQPVYIGIVLNVIIGIILMAIFFKYDFLTIFITFYLFLNLNLGLSLITVGDSYYSFSGMIFLGIFAVILIISSIGLFTKDKINDFERITPVFAKNITERERLQRELEIAKDVQMSFLPNKDPQFEGLDISAKCIPALEVGGDYYDFVKLSDKKIGIIIGDVSGKGTQAAFYMTLTKGFVKALSKSTYSPAKMLKLMNELFYENVERGTFISMIYGIFDIESNTLKIARAGHNPLIVKSSLNNKTEFINSTGLALGLERGTIFQKTIDEVEIKIQKGDTFVFYTDGFTEAMNSKKEEFSEERLINSVEANSTFPSIEVLEKIIKDVKVFIGKAQQHDDMTMVIVKVT